MRLRVILILAALTSLVLMLGCTGSMRLAVTGMGGGEMQQPIGPSPTGPGGGALPTAPGSAPTGGMSDVTASQPAQQPQDPNIRDALKGIRDYEVTYDTSKSHADNTPPELRELGVVYAGEESPVAKRTQAIESLDLVGILGDRYSPVEEEYAADPEKDFAPDDPERTLNYFQPRADPFAIPELIPEELRPEYEGQGLEGTVDQDLLEQLLLAQYEANLRYVPIIVIGVLQSGPYRGVIWTIAGAGFTDFLQEGDSRCVGAYGRPFSVYCAQASEDYVVLILTGMYDRGCRYPATNGVVRTFHVNR